MRPLEREYIPTIISSKSGGVVPGGRDRHTSHKALRKIHQAQKNIGASALLHAAAPGLGDGNEGRCVRGHEWVSSTVPIRLQQAFFGEGGPGARAHACSPLREWSCRKKRRAGLPLLRAAPEEAVGDLRGVSVAGVFSAPDGEGKGKWRERETKGPGLWLSWQARVD